jgi:hypothetical protein
LHAGPELAFPVYPKPAVFPPGSASVLALLVDPTPVAFSPGSASASVSQTLPSWSSLMKFCTASHVESGKQWVFAEVTSPPKRSRLPIHPQLEFDQKVLLTLAVLYRIHSPNVELL